MMLTKSLFSPSKSPLAKLRKNTGYSLSICKKALEQNDQDLIKAEEWLKKQAQAEGWAKASKLQGRNAAQGLIGILLTEKRASMVELNCETDFVARNSTFHILLNEIAAVTLRESEKFPVEDDDLSIKFYDQTHLHNLKSISDSDKSLADLVALNIGKIGENIVLKRGCSFSTSNNVDLMAVTHPSAAVNSKDVYYGRFGTILAYVKDKNIGVIPEGQTEATMARQLCQHIIGMNPCEIGSFDSDMKNSETQLLHQDFLLDDEVKVDEVLKKIGMSVRNFVRWEVGQSIED